MSLLDVDDVNSYYGKSHILQDVSLEVRDGDLVTLIGRNGAGKSTTLKSIMGMVQPKSGTVTFDGEDVTGLKPHQISRRGIAMVPERRRIFPRHTVLENLRLGYLEHADESMDALLADVYEYFPDLEEKRHQHGGDLSGGQQQMLAIARGLMSSPKLLLIDEPTEGLMPRLVEQLRDILPRINDEGITVLLVEQNVELALDISDYGYVIDEGVIQTHGPAGELAADEEIAERYLSL